MPFVLLLSLAVQITVGAIIMQPQTTELVRLGQTARICHVGTAFRVTAGFAHAGRIRTTVSAQNHDAAMLATDHSSIADLALNGMGSNGGGTAS